MTPATKKRFRRRDFWPLFGGRGLVGAAYAGDLLRKRLLGAPYRRISLPFQLCGGAMHLAHAVSIPAAAVLDVLSVGDYVAVVKLRMQLMAKVCQRRRVLRERVFSGSRQYGATSPERGEQTHLAISDDATAPAAQESVV